MTTPSTLTPSPSVLAALFRSAVYEALSLGFTYPTTEQRERLEVLLEDMLAFEIEIAPALRESVAALAAALAATDLVSQQVEYNRVFDQSMLCSPFETEYEADPFAKARQMADISGFYTAFGLAVSSERPTLHDFIGSELEFMSSLARKEAYAAAKHWTRRLEIASDAEAKFLRDHLGRWERTMCADLVAALVNDDDATARFYTVLAHVCEQFVEDELRRFRVRPLRLKRRMVGEREAMVCPLAPQVPALDAGSLAFGDAEEFAESVGFADDAE